MPEKSYWEEYFDNTSPTWMEKFAKLEGDRMFARLGSRSPKDNQTEIRSGNDVLQAFCDSERVLDDLMLCTKMKYDPYVFVRQWVNIPKDKEFRCFVKDWGLRGISQYF